MGKRGKLLRLTENITTHATEIDYLLQNAIYKPDNARETFVLVDLAIKLNKNIHKYSEKITKIIE